MTPQRHLPPKPTWDRELDAWLEHAMGVKRPDPEPVIHDLDD